MAIDFTLSAEQKALQSTAREFAQKILGPLVARADAAPNPQRAFQMVKPAYVEAYKLGLAMAAIPREYGGGGASHVDLQIVMEEICAVDPGFACTLMGNAMALMPLVWFGSKEQKKKWLGEATNDRTGQYLAGWVMSEPPGVPGGTASFDHPDPHPVGQATTAVHDRARGEYVLNGHKYWPSNAAGWDFKGANVNTVTVRTDKEKGGREGLSCILIPRGTPGMRFEPNIDKLGHRLTQNVNMVFESCRVPEENVFAVGKGDLAISKIFTWSGPMCAIAATAVGRSAYEYTLGWAKTFTAGGDKPIIHHQAVGYLLADVAMRIEACRYLSWKAAHYLDQFDSEGHAFSAMAKVFCSETMLDSVCKCMQVMGTNSLDKNHPMERFLREAAVLPVYDGGNIGMQRRRIWGVMCDAEYDPRAFVDNRPVRFKKTMEGLGVKELVPEPLRA